MANLLPSNGSKLNIMRLKNVLFSSLCNRQNNEEFGFFTKQLLFISLNNNFQILFCIVLQNNVIQFSLLFEQQLIGSFFACVYPGVVPQNGVRRALVQLNACQRLVSQDPASCHLLWYLCALDPNKYQYNYILFFLTNCITIIRRSQNNLEFKLWVAKSFKTAWYICIWYRLSGHYLDSQGHKYLWRVFQSDKLFEMFLGLYNDSTSVHGRQPLPPAPFLVARVF